MEYLVKDLKKAIGKKVSLKGWLRNRRSSGKIVFLEFRDGTGEVQVVCSAENISREILNIVDHLPIESSIGIEGTVKSEKRAPTGVEIVATNINIIQRAEEYPISKKQHGTKFLFDNRHLWIRSPRIRAIMKVRNTIMESMEKYLRENGFIRIDAPIIVGSSCEGAETLFELKYFDKRAFLSQSGQLYMEAAAMAYRKVYCFGPTFRAEKSKTRRHLTEFWMLEPEMAFADLEKNMKIQEEIMDYTLDNILSKNEEDLRILGRDIEKIEKAFSPYERIDYKDAIRLLKKMGSDIKEGEDLGADDETILTKSFEKPVFIHHYPSEVKAFYMTEEGDTSTVKCSDLLAPEGYGEIIGGSERIWNYEDLLRKIKKFKLPLKDLEWYVDLRRYGSVPHAGFGIGIERVVVWICGLKHVREAIPFPRTINRLYP